MLFLVTILIKLICSETLVVPYSPDSPFPLASSGPYDVAHILCYASSVVSHLLFVFFFFFIFYIVVDFVIH